MVDAVTYGELGEIRELTVLHSVDRLICICIYINYYISTDLCFQKEIGLDRNVPLMTGHAMFRVIRNNKTKADCKQFR